jgi:hypothetical protein
MFGQQPSSVIPAAKAAHIWRLYGFNSPSDLILEDLALAMGVIVVEGRLDSAEARLLRKGTRGLIRVRENVPEVGRKRFAIAHEIGHWLLHSASSQILACTSEDMVAKYKASAPEIEANYFAAELLMPEKLFAPLIRGVRPSTVLIKDLASQFTTTLTACATRVADLADDYFAVVFSERGRIRWWRGSKSFEEQFWIEAGTLLAQESLAARFFRDGTVPAGPHRINSLAWLEQAAHVEVVFEEVIAMPNYGQVISLISLA